MESACSAVLFWGRGPSLLSERTLTWAWMLLLQTYSKSSCDFFQTWLMCPKTKRFLFHKSTSFAFPPPLCIFLHSTPLFGFLGSLRLSGGGGGYSGMTPEGLHSIPQPDLDVRNVASEVASETCPYKLVGSNLRIIHI